MTLYVSIVGGSNISEKHATSAFYIYPGYCE